MTARRQSRCDEPVSFRICKVLPAAASPNLESLALLDHHQRWSAVGNVHAFTDGVSRADDLSERAQEFAVRTLRFVRTLQREIAIDSIARQLARSAPSVSANYRSARRARSRAEFIARLAVVVDEADESEHWLSIIREGGMAASSELEWLLDESRQLRAIFERSVTTARLNQKSAQRG